MRFIWFLKIHKFSYGNASFHCSAVLLSDLPSWQKKKAWPILSLCFFSSVSSHTLSVWSCLWVDRVSGQVMYVIWKVLQNFVILSHVPANGNVHYRHFSNAWDNQGEIFLLHFTNICIFSPSGKEEKDKLLPNQNGVLGKQVLHWKVAKCGSQGTYMKS